MVENVFTSLIQAKVVNPQCGKTVLRVKVPHSKSKYNIIIDAQGINNPSVAACKG